MNDLISRQAIIDAIDDISWYHQNDNGEIVQGAKDKSHAWYKAEDVYKALAEVRTQMSSADYISRQEAIDDLYGRDPSQIWDTADIEVWINALPSAEPEIIRCKNCIWFDRYTDGIEKYQWDGFCAEWARNTYENWYCGRAERR